MGTESKAVLSTQPLLLWVPRNPEKGNLWLEEMDRLGWLWVTPCMWQEPTEFIGMKPPGLFQHLPVHLDLHPFLGLLQYL